MRECTCLKTRELMRSMARLYDRELRQAGLKTTQFGLLAEIAALGPVTAGRLARGLKLDPSTLTRNLRPLIDAGWAQVCPGADGRSRHVRLTAAGQAKLAEGNRQWRIAEQALHEMLGHERVARLHALIDESMAVLLPLRAGAWADGR